MRFDADLNPVFVNALSAYNETSQLPLFDDTSVVQVTVSVGSSRKLHWDWTYKARYQQPWNMFQVNVVAQNGQVTNVVPIVSAPANWGWNPCGFTGNQTIYAAGPQSVDLDLTPWKNQTIKIQFSLRNFYDPHFIDSCILFGGPQCSGGPCLPWPPGTWDIPTAKAYVTNLHVDDCPGAINNPANPVTPVANNPNPGNIDATFTPGLGLSVHDAAVVCGFVDFDWVQIVTHMDDPVWFSARNEGGAFDPTISGPVKLSSARVPFHDPPRAADTRAKPRATTAFPSTTTGCRGLAATRRVNFPSVRSAALR